MSNENNGLRFDIYERVHLPEDVAAIEELEEIELVPRIQVVDQGDHALLKGQLLLNGIYRGQDTNGEQLALEHWIPVEISLPMSRVSRLDDITVDIDNFDVDLLAPRTMNITGILSLRGILLEQEQSGQSWETEAFTAVHERDNRLEEEQDALLDEERIEAEQEEENVSELASEWDNFQAVEQMENLSTEQPWLSSLVAREEAPQEEIVSVIPQQSEPEAEQWNEISMPYAVDQRVIDEIHSSSLYLSGLYQQEPNEFEEEVRTEEEFELEDTDASPYIQTEYAYSNTNDDHAGEELWRENEQEIEIQAEEQAYSQAPVEWRFDQSIIEEDKESVFSSRDEEREYLQQEEALSYQAYEEQDQQYSQYESEIFKDNQAENEVPQEPHRDVEQELELSDSNNEAEAVADFQSEKKQGVQIAFSGSNEKNNDSLGIRSILSSSLRDQAAKEATIQQKELERKAEEAANEAKAEDEMEWKGIFLSNRKGQNEFKKIKMCIVQKEETLEQIATRYSLNPRELLLHNKLHESAIAEGQLLYIP